MSIRLIVAILLVVDPIGSGLSDGIRLTYASGDAVQEPWVYESVRIAARDEFARCVVVVRRGQPERETCARGDTLFTRRATGDYVATRPIGPNMELEVHTGSGDVLHYSTGQVATARVQAHTVPYLPTTITTRNANGDITRRLREHYAPSLLTAIWGVFEEPEAPGSWRAVREFTLVAIQPAEPGP